MPIPFILGAIALGAAGFGVKKGIDAMGDYDLAKSNNNEAQQIVEKAKKSVKNKKKSTKNTLQELGKQKITLLSTSVNDFVTSFERLKDIQLKETEGITELKNFKPDSVGFVKLKEASIEAKNLAADGIAAIGGGTLMALGTYNVVMGGLGGLLVTATTGTALGTLSGAAATNATLAWLGGGALSAGGFGMAGGAAVLGGLVVGPALAIGGALLAGQADKAYWDSCSNLDKAKEFKAQCGLITSKLGIMQKRAKQMNTVLIKLNNIFVPLVSEMTVAIDELCSDRGMSGERQAELLQQKVYPCASAALAIKAILDTAIMDDKGEILESAEDNIKVAEKFITDNSSNLIAENV